MRLRTGVVAALAAVLMMTPLAAGAQSNLLVVVSHIDDYGHPGQQFLLDLSGEFDLPGVTDVVASVGGIAYPLAFELASGEWASPNDVTFTTLADVRSALGGEWTVTTSGSLQSAVSSTRFSFDTSGLVDADFFPTPSGLSPADGATGVSPDVTISWIDPTGSSVPFGLVVDVSSFNPFLLDQEVFSFDGGIGVGGTSWQPPFSLDEGSNELTVLYVDGGDPSTLGSFAVDSGSIGWGSHPLAPLGYPADRPLLALASETSVAFTVVPEPAAAARQLAALAVLAGLAHARRSRGVAVA